MNQKESYVMMFLLFLAVVMFFGLAVVKYNSDQTLKLTKERLANIERGLNYIEEFQDQNQKKLQLNNKKLELTFKKMESLKEAIDPEKFKLVAVTKTRDAILAGLEHFEHRKHMSNLELITYAKAVVQWAEEYNVPIPLVLAMTHTESHFNPNGTSNKGAQGLIQIMPGTAAEIAQDLGVHRYSMYQIRDNVRFGIYYISEMMHKFDNVIEHAVPAYNCGPTYMHKYLLGKFKSLPEETQGYIELILGDEGYYKFYSQQGL